MKNIQIKKPYVAPELTVVDFRVERGMQTSGEIQYHGDGVKAVENELGLMMFISSQGNAGGARMGDQMGYFGPTGGYFSTPGPTVDGSTGGYF